MFGFLILVLFATPAKICSNCKRYYLKFKFKINVIIRGLNRSASQKMLQATPVNLTFGPQLQQKALFKAVLQSMQENPTMTGLQMHHGPELPSQISMR
jgi:hypothetical protein